MAIAFLMMGVTGENETGCRGSHRYLRLSRASVLTKAAEEAVENRNFALAHRIAAVEGMSGSPVISTQGEVPGMLTLAGGGRFRGFSCVASFEEPKKSPRAEGVIAPDLPHPLAPLPQAR